MGDGIDDFRKYEEREKEVVIVEKHIFSVSDMACEHCVKAITGALEGVLPPSDFEVLLSTKQVVLKTGDPLVLERAEAALRNEGYTPARVL